MAITTLAEIDVVTGNYAEAEARLAPYLERAAATGGELAVPFAVIHLARSAVAQGNGSDALALLDPVIEETRELQMTMVLAWPLIVRAQAHALLADDAAANESIAEARAVAASIDNTWLVAAADAELAQLVRRAGDSKRADDLDHGALRARADGAWLPDVVASLEALAFGAAASESHAEACRLLAAASALRETLGVVRPPAQADDFDAALDGARRSLGDAEFAAAWTEGRLLTATDAVAYASRARGERKRPSAGWQSLTPMELRVVECVAEGMTNPQIAERLFVARGTVKVHLTHIFTKLGVATRSELAAHATRRASG
jgi:DNA-binding CsgD family transcriptional regulator